MSDAKLIVEVAQRRKSTLKSDQVIELVWSKYLCDLSAVETPTLQHYPQPSDSEITVSELAANVESIGVCNVFHAPLTRLNVEIFVFKIIDGGSVEQKLNNGNQNAGNGTSSGDDNDQPSASHHWLLPTREYHGLWESLHFEPGVKEDLLQFVDSSMLFAARSVDPHLISCNRLVLLHGPPGTGKTSLCKAIAQKLAIRCARRYRFTHLIEINSHSLFSKWFSESGKLVQKLFDDIKRVLDHSGSLVCLLIDEVESVAFARANVSANEPSDSLRVVNAVLTQLDQIRLRPNVLVLTTSNLTATIDVAFLDRADIRQYIGPPTAEAIRAVYQSAIGELQRTGIIVGGEDGAEDDCSRAMNREKLQRLAVTSVGLSGRTLRKLPFLAHALHLGKESATLAEFLVALEKAVLKHRESTGQLAGC